VAGIKGSKLVISVNFNSLAKRPFSLSQVNYFGLAWWFSMGFWVQFLVSELIFKARDYSNGKGKTGIWWLNLPLLINLPGLKFLNWFRKGFKTKVKFIGLDTLSITPISKFRNTFFSQFFSPQFLFFALWVSKLSKISLSFLFPIYFRKGAKRRGNSFLTGGSLGTAKTISNWGLGRHFAPKAPL